MKYTPTKELLALDESERIRWAVELDTGEYKQAKDTLYDGYGYCCLGVWEWCNGHDPKILKNKDYPDELKSPTKLDGIFPNDISAAESDDGFHKFSSLNDSKNFTFPEIAQILRGNEVVK